MCIVKATETEIEAETETATEAEANRGDALTKCYEIKFTHKASLMTRQATRTARRQGQQQQQQQQQIITTTTEDYDCEAVLESFSKCASGALNCLITQEECATYLQH